MDGGTLLGHLVGSFAAHPENVATQSLAFILQKSATARRALERLLQGCCPGLPDEVRYRSQAWGEDQTVPDLVGFDDAGEERVFIEAKFWAGLTEKQPVVYIKRLTAGKPGLLLFVAPERRQPTLWPELIRRCAAAQLVLTESAAPLGVTAARVSNGTVLALVSWRALLARVNDDLVSANEGDAAADVRQLHGLCERMDTDAFLPLRSEDLSPGIPRLVIQLTQLVFDASRRAIEEGFADAKRLKASSVFGECYVAYLRFGDVGVSLRLDFSMWASQEESPLWLGIHGTEWRPETLHGIRAKLADLEGSGAIRILTREPGGELLCVPLTVPLGIEKEQAIQAIVAQMRPIAERVRQSGPTTQVAEGGPPADVEPTEERGAPERPEE
ncbi:MAG TPA: hypothetical protein PLE19_10735 [Planctomycetota bacterium]|nr:hypothetical protein [Planctomycetota bacterium]HRR79034.1 hypothetical protein [Planctomycetota bacterium]HRT95497.1 hypothetical protein [Planctomycetota bacterium]